MTIWPWSRRTEIEVDGGIVTTETPLSDEQVARFKAAAFARHSRGPIVRVPTAIPDGWVNEYARQARKAHALGKDYGRASRTIAEQRGVIARLRAERDESVTQADVLADALGCAGCTSEYVLSRAQTAGRLLAERGERELAQLRDRVLGRWRDVETVERAERYGDEIDPPHDRAGCSICVSADHHEARRAEFVRRLRDVAGSGVEADVASSPTEAGAPAPGDPIAAVVRVLTEHELLADDQCRCRWGYAIGPIWHADHVAERLAAAGLVRAAVPAPRPTPRVGSFARGWQP